MKASLQKVATHTRPAAPKPAVKPFFGGQPRLKTGRKGDKFEREADAMADRVVSGQTQRGLAAEVAPVRGLDLERQPMDREEQEPVQRKEEELPEAQLAESTEEDKESQLKAEEEPELQQQEEDRDRDEGAQLQEEAQTADSQEERPENDNVAQNQNDDTAREEDLQKQESDETEQVHDAPLQQQSGEGLKGQSQAEDEETTQSKAAADPAVASPRANVTDLLRSKRGRGSPLPEAVRSKMEQRFSADFTGVRIHPEEVALTRLLGAQAFTSGADIFFNRGKYNPATRSGEHLLAHELTHTIQQGAAKATAVFLGRPTVHVPQNKNEEQLQSQKDDEEASDTYLIRPELVEAIRLARSQVGRVDANLTNADGTRVGWERLKEYFEVAFGGLERVDISAIKKKRMAYLPKHGTNTKEWRDAMPSWCGIFVWWAMKKSGVNIRDWQLGSSAFNQFKIRGPRELPQKGDIAHAEDNAHWALVSGVESTSDAAGKPFQNIMVRTINGNTAGKDTRGGQVQELWHPISRWIGFFDPVARLNMPPAELVRVGREPDLDEGVPEVEEEKHEIPSSDLENLEEVKDAAPEPPPVETAAVAVDLPPPVEQGSPEEIAKIPELDLSGSSDQAMVAYTNSSPSQMGANLPAIGQTVTDRAESEKKDQAENPPVLTAKTSGKVEGGITPPSGLAVPTEPRFTDKDTDNIKDFGHVAHENRGTAPSTHETRKDIEKQPPESLFAWLKRNMLNIISRIRIRDPGVNTSAGPRQKVRLTGKADPGRIKQQRADATGHVKGKRDELTDKLKKHPGQQNIQGKAVEVDNTVSVKVEPGEPALTEADQDVADYVAAPLPEDVRAGADAEIAKTLEPNITSARGDTEAAALKRDTDRSREIENAKAETAKINTGADAEQRRVVLKGRSEVAQQQESGISEAYGEVDAFRKESDTKQREAHEGITNTTKTAEEKSHKCLKDAEDEAKRRKTKAEEDAAKKKKELKEKNKDKSWWEKGVRLVKRAVSTITKAIDGIFNALREGIAFLINEAKKAAIKLINKAREAVIGLLNEFRNWAKDRVNEYLGKRFPDLAAKINRGIDTTVDTAITGVNKAADAAIKGVEILASALGKLLDKILATFQTALKAAVEIAGAVVTGDLAGALKAAIRAACDIAGIDSKPIFDFIDRAGKQIKAILKNPKPFFNNLMKAVGDGARSFVKNIKKHLIGGLIGWLTGALSEVAITLPEKFDAKGIFSLGMQILGLTYENIKAKVIKRFPPAEKIFGAIEKGIEIIRKISKPGGISELWQEVKQSIGNFKEMVLGAIRGFVITTVVKEAVVWLLSLLNPAAAIVKLVKLLFDFVMFLVERFQQIKEFVLSVYNTLASAAAGTFAKVSQGVEDAMARSLPVVISLLARLAGLGGIGKTVKKLIGKVSRPVNKVINKIIDRVIKFAKKLLKKGKKAAKKVAAKFAKWWKVKRRFKGDDGENHSLLFKGQGASATLTVKSSEQSYSQFLAWATKQEDADKKAAKEAKNLAKKIDEEKARKLKGRTDAEKEKDSKKKKAEVERLIGLLQGHTKKLFGESLPESEVDWGSPTSAGFGSSMKAKALTTKRKDPKLKGSPPTQAPHKVYDKLNQRRQRGGASYYIRGHLLNDNVGGPGKWFNMTPLSRQGNKLHESKAESIVKAGVNSGAILEYNVVPQYGKRPNGNAIVAKAGAGLAKQEKDTLKDIVDSENDVPTSLTIKIATKEKKNGGFKTVNTQNPSVENPIDRNPDSYFLSGGGKKIIPIDVNNITGSAPLKSLDITDNLRNNAGPIWSAVEKRRKDNKPAFGTYATLSDESGVPITAEDSEYLVLRARNTG